MSCRCLNYGKKIIVEMRLSIKFGARFDARDPQKKILNYKG